MAKVKCVNYPRKCRSWGQVNSDGLCPACVRRQERSVLLDAIRIDVLELHDNSGILSHLDIWREQGASYELIAQAIGFGVTSQDVRRVHLEKGINDNRKRRFFGLPKVEEREACLIHNKFHEYDCQTEAVYPKEAAIYDPTIQVPVPACPQCQKAHTHAHHEQVYDPRKPASKPRHYPPRLAIRKDDMARAARSILKHIEPEQVGELVELLTEGI